MNKSLDALSVWRANCLFCFVLLVLVGLTNENRASATDYVLTIGGGYNPSGNQATLEANVIFFQDILQEQNPGARVYETYFSDGFDRVADVQVLSKSAKTEQPATDLIASLHRRGPSGPAVPVEYRDHRVPNVAGPTDPGLIHASLSVTAKRAIAGDRLIVYVTSHGSAGKNEDAFNTTIDCWNRRTITVREFSGWLDEFSPEVPVVMVMAQCYCGGFARTIFEDFRVGDGSKRLSKQVRVGFFAQQHNLAAAGCRPDIDNDEEFSSYFWGAIAGRSRTGDPVQGCDIDSNGTISFAEAYAYAVIASNTIDIPLRASDLLLRTYSRLGGDASKSAEEENKEVSDDGAKPEEKKPELFAMTGTLENLVEHEGLIARRIVGELSKKRGFSMQDNIGMVVVAYDKQRSQRRGPPGLGGRRRRSESGRRELLDQIAEKWPELADQQNWQSSDVLRADNQKQLISEIKQLPAFEAYEQRQRQRVELDQQADENELKEVKLRRLIDAVEVVVLARNLPLVASPEVVKRYREMLSIEDSALSR